MSQSHLRRSAANLRSEIGRTPFVTPTLVAMALDLVTAHRPLPYPTTETQRVRALIDAQAWTDAVLAIADLDRSRAIQYLVYQDGEWHCGIGSCGSLPHWLGDGGEFSHPVLALAILGALIDTLARPPTTDVAPESAPQWRSGEANAISAVSCDNYR